MTAKNLTFVQRRDIHTDTSDVAACWLWGGALSTDGYGKVKWQGKDARAHRVAFVEAWGEVPDGMTVDHVCFRRACVNPAHLRLLSRPDNCARQRRASKTRCKNGHPFDADNTYDRSRNNGPRRGRRSCRSCNADAARRYQAKKRESA